MERKRKERAEVIERTARSFGPRGAEFTGCSRGGIVLVTVDTHAMRHSGDNLVCDDRFGGKPSNVGG